jgi:hypothetical protein
MNAKTTIVAAALALIAGAAGAADLVQIPTERGALTRAEVQAELARARAAGELDETTDWLTQRAIAMRTDPAQQAVARSRADVQAEAMAAAHTRSFEFDPGSVGG